MAELGWESKRINKEVPDAHKVKVISQLFNNPIVGHLPEEFGFGVGSEFSEPFSSILPEGRTAQIAQAISGMSMKHGIVSERFYSGAEPADFSFDLEFHSFYSAKEEVVIPIVKLLMLGVGIENELIEDGEEIAEKLDAEQFFDQLPVFADSARDWVEDINVSVFMSHDPITIKFGDSLTVSNIYFQNVSYTFSNVLEQGEDGAFPIKGTASINAIFRTPPSHKDIATMFGQQSRITSL